MSEYRFTIDVSRLEGKQGKLKKNNDGYYEDVLVGVFNVENSIGERYIIDQDVLSLLDMSLERSQMARWLKQGKLIGEKEHPHLQDFLSKDRDLATARSLWVQRNAELRVDNIAMRYAGIRTEAMPDKVDGRTVYGVYALMRPTDPELALAMEDRNSNTAFSLRSFIKRYISGAEMLRKCTNIFTFDWVNNNGIKYAEKYNQPGLESESLGVHLDNGIIRNLNDLMRDDMAVAGLESSAGIITRVIKEAGVWREVPDITTSLSLASQWGKATR